MRKKILFITNSFPAPEYRRLWKKVTSLAREDYDIRVISPIGSKRVKTQSFKKIKVYYYKKKDRENTFWSFFKGELSDFIKVNKIALKIYMKEKFDVIHITNPSDTLALTGIIYKFFKCLFVYENNQNYPQKIKSLSNNKTIIEKLTFKILQKIEKKVVYHAQLIIVPECKQRIRIARMFPKKRDKIITIEPLPDLKDFYHPFLNKDYKRGFKHMVIYTGSLRRGRGIMKLMQVIKFIVTDLRRNDILFVLAGEGPDKDTIKNFSKKNNLESSTYFPGWLNQQKLLTYLTAADLGIILEEEKTDTSCFRDSLFEFMAMGKPVISYNSNTGLCRVGDAGSFVEGHNELIFAKEIIKILDNKDRSKIMGELGKLKVEKKFNWIHSEIKLISAYNKLLQDLKEEEERENLKLKKN